MIKLFFPDWISKTCSQFKGNKKFTIKNYVLKQKHFQTAKQIYVVL